MAGAGNTQGPGPHLQWQNFRDITLFLGGLGGVFHETVIQTGERPTLLILFAAMMGLPAFLRADDVRSRGGPPATPPENPANQAENPQ